MYTSTGVLSYQAPEILNGEPYTSKVDIWYILSQNLFRQILYQRAFCIF